MKTLSGLQIPKIKWNCLNNASGYVDFFTFTTLLWLVLFDVFQVKPLCDATITGGVRPFFALFALNFQVPSCIFQYYLAARRIEIMIKLIILNIFGQPNCILTLKKGFDETLKNIAAVSKDLLRISWKCMKIALIF